MIDPKKTYRTRDGREVRIYAVDGLSVGQIHGAVNNGRAHWVATEWERDGSSCNHPSLDLIEVRPKHTLDVWVNFYSDKGISVHPTKDKADWLCGSKRIACLHIVREYEEGEGL